MELKLSTREFEEELWLETADEVDVVITRPRKKFRYKDEQKRLKQKAQKTGHVYFSDSKQRYVTDSLSHKNDFIGLLKAESNRKIRRAKMTFFKRCNYKKVMPFLYILS